MTRPVHRDGGGIGPLLVILGLGLAFRALIVVLLPGSGFRVDIDSFGYWASNLADQGLSGFYDRPFFHDYTPGYLYVLWVVGEIGKLFGGGPGDLIKVPPILADVALAYLVWSMARELGASERAARIGALIVVVNPVTWFDSALWGQVDSVGVVVLLLALRELWRDRPERSAVLAMLAALIKPQLGILIPIVAVVTIRRALWPSGGYGADDPGEIEAVGGTAWERRVKGPIRILTTGLAGLATAILVSLPFGLSLPGLIAQVFKTAAGYPYLSVNAYNPWALVSQAGRGIAADRSWVCDSTVVPSGPFEIRIGDWLLYSSPASTATCPDGFTLAGIPAVLLGAVLFVVVAAVVLWIVGRRPDRRTMLVGLAVLALAFFVLPTRVHERYLFPLVGIAAIPAAASMRWRLAYAVSSAAMLANMYAVLTTLYPNNPGIADWLRIGDVLTSWSGVAVAAACQLAVLGWTFLQLRGDRLDELDGELADEGGGGLLMGTPLAAALRNLLAPPAAGSPVGPSAAGTAPAEAAVAPATAPPSPGQRPAAPPNSQQPRAAPPGTEPPSPAGGLLMPTWGDTGGAASPAEWLRARFRDRPVRADRSASLAGEPGGRLDKLDVWLIAVLVLSLATVRFWRLSEPYDMHFDEVYHPRTAMEFLQYWRYGISHDIYEWTHPHLAKYVMAIGMVAFGNDQTAATTDLTMPRLRGATIEPRWPDPVNARSGDRLWLVGDDQVRAYDLATRALIATWPLPGASAVSVDTTDHRAIVGATDGGLWTIDTAALDLLRAANTPVTASGSGSAAAGVVEPVAFAHLDGPITGLRATDDGAAIEAAVGTGATGSLVSIDGSGVETGRAKVAGVRQIVDLDNGTVAVAHTGGVAIVDSRTGKAVSSISIDGTIGGITTTSGLSGNPLYVSTLGSDGPRLVVLTVAAGGTYPTVSTSFRLPGAAAGPVYFDAASRMVHAVGTTPAAGGWFEGSTPGSPTVYAIDPAGSSNAVYADAALPFSPTAIAMDDNRNYPTSDRQQLLAFSAGGQMAAVPIGDHAFAWRVPGVIAGILMAALAYVLARLLFRRRSIAIITGFLFLVDGMLFVQSRIGMNDSYVGLFIVAAYTLFAWLWLGPGGSRRQWVAFVIGMPVLGLLLGLALASKWVAAYAIGSLGILILARSALGRLLLLAGLVVVTTVLGYMGISVPEGAVGGNYLFLAIMVALTLAAVVACVLHPIAWTWEEQRLAIYGPIVAGILVTLAALATGQLEHAFTVSSLSLTPLEIGFAGIALGIAMYSAFVVAGRYGFGPMAGRPAPDDPAALLPPPAVAPRGWLNLGSGFGLPAVYALACLIGLPLIVYVISYIPWAFVQNHQLLPQLWPGWPDGHTGTGTLDTLPNLTVSMYGYHNNLTAAHPASSPWWAWPFDLKPVWFYQDSFAGGTTASIYNAGNLVSWWLAIPAMGFAAWQTYKRRSVALGLVVIAFACQWLSWARIDRAEFQYHYYTALPFLLMALAYLIAELWHGPSWRTWVLVRLAGAAAVLGPFAFWLLHRPLCAIAQVNAIDPGSSSCPTTIPDLALSPRTIALAVVVGLGLLLVLRQFLSPGSDDDLDRRTLIRGRLARAAWIAIGVVVAVTIISIAVPSTSGLHLQAVPVEPIALVVLVALLPVAAYVATARDARRFALGMLAAIGLWFVLWYPNISALPMPSAITNIYQGLLPTYLYSFQFWTNTTSRGVGPSLLAPLPIILLVVLAALAVAVAYSAWSWRLTLAERARDAARGAADSGAAEPSA